MSSSRLKAFGSAAWATPKHHVVQKKQSNNAEVQLFRTALLVILKPLPIRGVKDRPGIAAESFIQYLVYELKSLILRRRLFFCERATPGGGNNEKLT
jgi:hypothetical protein